MAVGRRASARVAGWTSHPWPMVGVLAVAAAKLADDATTAVALTFLPLVELNPLIRSLIAQVGIVPGLLIGSSVAIGLVTLITETGVFVSARLSGDQAQVAKVRYAGYGLATAVFGAAAIYNFALILSVL